MKRTIFDYITVPQIEFRKRDRDIVSYSEVTAIDGEKVVVTYFWVNKALTVINVLSKREYISKNLATGKTTMRGRLWQHVLGKSDRWKNIRNAATCRNDDLDEIYDVLDSKIIDADYFKYDNETVLHIVDKYIDLLNEEAESKNMKRREKRENDYFSRFKAPRFPKGFIEYCKKWIRGNDLLFISKNKRNGEYKGYCTHCGGNFAITRYNYVGERVVCACCGAELQFCFDHKDDTKIMFAANVGYFEKVKGEVAIRLFHIYRDRRNSYDDLSEADFKEYARYVLTDRKTYCWLKEYRYGMGNRWSECGWYSTGFRVFDSYFALYDNIADIGVNTPLLKYRNIIGRGAHTDTGIFKVLSAQRKYPCLEYLQAQGWTNIVRDVIAGDSLNTLDLKGRTANEVFGIDVNKVKKYGTKINTLQLCAIKLADKHGLTINDDVLKYLNGPTCDMEWTLRQIEKLFAYVKPIKFVNYARAQKLHLSTYCDYINQLIKLGLDTESEINLYPKDFTAAHFKLSQLITAQEKKVFETAVETVYVNYHELCEWSKDGYTVLMAKNCQEIVKEGAELKHCVGNYCERVAKGESVILFLRRAEEPDKSFYTMEIRPDMRKFNLIQCRGYANDDYSPEIRAEVDAFLAKYERWFNRRSAAGFDRDSVVSKYYKAVHKTEDGRYYSGWDRKTEYVIGEISEAETDPDPDKVAVKGLHIASLEFAQRYGDLWKDVAILEVEVNINDVIVPDAKDQIRTSRFKVLREMPMEEMGDWGERHMPTNKNIAAESAA